MSANIAAVTGIAASASQTPEVVLGLVDTRQSRDKPLNLVAGRAGGSGGADLVDPTVSGRQVGGRRGCCGCCRVGERSRARLIRDRCRQLPPELVQGQHTSVDLGDQLLSLGVPRR